MLKQFKKFLAQIKFHIFTLYYLAKNPDLPLLNKLIALFAVYYFLSPIDLIPDFIPLFGQLDDLLIVPFGIWLVYRLTPKSLIEKAQVQAKESKLELAPKFVFAFLIILIWILLLILILKYFYDIRN